MMTTTMRRSEREVKNLNEASGPFFHLDPCGACSWLMMIRWLAVEPEERMPD